LAYLAAPALGWHIESASIAAAFGALPVIMKVGLKSIFALPFTYHSFNGLRHLSWDFGLGFKNQTVKQTGWIAVGVSVVTALGLALLV
jgi:succinate dehydrogenase (ubiquinone) cytochrome b560 subunit